MSLPKFTGSTSSLFQVVGSPQGSISSAGEVWSVTYEGNYDYYMANRFVRWTISNDFAHIPNNLYLDEIKETVIFPTGGGTTGGIRVELTFRGPENMSDSSGGETPTIPAKYECFTKVVQIPLHQMKERYPAFNQYVGADVNSGKLFDYALAWKNAVTVEDRAEAWNKANSDVTDSAQRSQLVDYWVKTSQGVEIVERNVPVLRRTLTQNSSPSTTSTGFIDTPPSGFAGIAPSGYEWRKITFASVRNGRVGPYQVVEEWEGSPNANGGFNNDLYGSAEERATNYKSFGAA